MNIHDAAAQGDCDQVRKELRNGVAVDTRDERDYTPLARAAGSLQAGEEILRLLIEAGADVNAPVDEGRHAPLDLAAGSGDLGKARLLLDAGADIGVVSPKGYTALLKVLYPLNSHAALLPILDWLIQQGAEIDCESDYGESALSVASRMGRLDAVQLLLDAGADPSPLRWSPLLKAVALGTCGEVDSLLKAGSDLNEEDRFSRTALHLAALAGDIRKAELLHSRGCKIDHLDRGGESALMVAAGRGNVEMLHWLIEHGADLEAVNGMDDSVLAIAAQNGQAECVKVLLESGANPNRRSQFQQSAMSQAASEEVIRLLIAAGQDWTDVSPEMRRQLVGLPQGGPINVTAAEYRAGRDRRFGRRNPESMRVPFWEEMVRTGVNAYQPRRQFDDVNCMSQPVWCFDRFGMSFTELPDGGFVQIGGEHEDHYDPDFCIYNEVVIHDRAGHFEIMGYPEEVFPPTDFHSATLVEGVIYIIGRLGYHGTRQFGVTPVYRLNWRTWKIEPVETRGDNPGWIFKHKVRCDGPNSLIVSEGTVCCEINGEEDHVPNEARFRLDLNSMRWTRL